MPSQSLRVADIEWDDRGVVFLPARSSTLLLSSRRQRVLRIQGSYPCAMNGPAGHR
jgi:hypothetical protein